MADEKITYEELDAETKQFLIDAYAPAFRRNYIKCKGFVFSEHFKNFADRIKNMEIRDDDIWVCTFPKSGTTWVQEMVWLLVNDLDYEGAKTKLTKRFPALEFSVTFDYNKLKQENPDFADAFCAFDSVDEAAKMKSPRFIKTHLPFCLLPDQLQKFSTKAKMIYVFRNPRDNFLSRYHYSKFMQGYEGTFEQFADLYLSGNVPYGPVPSHIKGFLEHADNPNLMLIRFEDMKKDLKSVVHKVESFFNKNLNEPEMNKLLDHLSFEKMKQNPAVNKKEGVDVRKKHNVSQADGDFLRRGVAGAWKDEMDPQLTERFEKWEKENFQGVDLTFAV